jgi:transcriptional repressor NrdR
VRCPYCGAQESKVVDSRDVDGSIRRRRQCLAAECGGRFTTYERVQAVALYVVKKDGRREEFSREKLLAGIRKACEKRPLRAGQIEAVAQEIENALYQSGAPEVLSSYLGEVVMERLRDLDAIAYVRFASVYRRFRDLDELRDELDALSSGGRPAGAQLPLIDEPAYAPPSVGLRPAAPQIRTRTRRPVRPVSAPVRLSGREPAPEEQPQKRRRNAR